MRASIGVLCLVAVGLVSGCGGGDSGGAPADGLAGNGGTGDVTDPIGSSGSGSSGTSGSTGSPSQRCAVVNEGTYVLEPTSAYDEISDLKSDETNLYFLDGDTLFATPLAGGAAHQLATNVDSYWVRDKDILIDALFGWRSVSKAGGTPTELPGLGISDDPQLAGDLIVYLASASGSDLYSVTTQEVDTGRDKTLLTLQSAERPTFTVVGQTAFVTTTVGTDRLGDPESPERRVLLHSVQLADGSEADVPVDPPQRNLRILGKSGADLILVGEPKNSGLDEQDRSLMIYALAPTGGKLRILGNTGETPLAVGSYAGVAFDGGMVVADTTLATKFFYVEPMASSATEISWCSETASVSRTLFSNPFEPQVYTAVNGNLYLSVRSDSKAAITRLPLTK